jgi:hypothetical protein
VSTDPAEDRFEVIDRLLDQQMMKHFEMAEMIGRYRDMLADLQEQRVPDEDMVKLARSLPGAKYHVNTTYVRENWIVIEAALKQLFPPPE